MGNEKFTFAGAEFIKRCFSIDSFCRQYNSDKAPKPWSLYMRHSDWFEEFYTREEREARWDYLKLILEKPQECEDTYQLRFRMEPGKPYELDKLELIDRQARDIRSLQTQVKEALAALSRREDEIDTLRKEKQALINSNIELQQQIQNLDALYKFYETKEKLLSKELDVERSKAGMPCPCTFCSESSYKKQIQDIEQRLRFHQEDAAGWKRNCEGWQQKATTWENKYHGLKGKIKDAAKKLVEE